MSRQVDERVVSMKFDNKQFESNARKTMDTLDSLKTKLNFTGASKGLDGINTAVKNVDMTDLSNSINTISTRFSALEVVGITALANITNSAVNAGKRMLNALTFEPITTGFKEYETQMNAVQTIMANTKSKGSTLEDVNGALAELNKYADQTIYNFTEMTRNIGTFTAAGVDLEKSVTSIKGIANLAAVSGSTSQQASVAMYQLSQALAAGTVKLQDWNSVVNAGMGGELFQNALKRTAEHFGTNVDAMIEKYGSFRESLSRGEWLTSEVLTETLTQLSGAYTEADLIAQGYSESQAKEIVDLAKTASEAATKVKTFTQLFDTMKEAAQSGWAQTWQTIIGDFEEAKELLTNISEFFTGSDGIITKMSDRRNTLLEGAFSSNWDKLAKKIEEAGVPLKTFNQELTKTINDNGTNTDELIKQYGSLKKAIEEGAVSGDLVSETINRISGNTDDLNKSTSAMTDKLEYFQKVVSEVWHGDWKNGEERIKALTEAGYNYSEVQDLVNKTVDGHKLTLEDLNVEQAKAIGYTDEQVKALQALAKEAEQAGTPINELINNLSKPDGRELLWDSFANAIQPIITLLKSIGEAWNDAFPPMASETLYNLIAGFNKFTEHLVIGKETAKNITDTLRGLFAILDLVATVVGGGFKIAFQVATKVIEALWEALGFGTANILEITGAVGRAIAGFRDWIEELDIIGNTVGIVVPAIVELGKSILNLIKSAYDLPIVQNSISGFLDVLNTIGSGASKFLQPILEALTEFFNNLSKIKDFNAEELSVVFTNLFNSIGSSLSNVNFMEVGKNIISGLIKGIQAGITTVATVMVEVGKALLTSICNFLGIHSPSKEMEDIGQFTIEGFVNGIQNGLQSVIKAIGKVVQTVIDTIKSIDLGDLAVVGIIGGGLFLANKFINILDKLTSPIESFASVFDGVADMFESISGYWDAKAMNLKSESLLNMAKAIGILAASLWVLCQVPTDKLLISIGALAGVGGMLVGLAAISNKIDDIKGFGKLSLLMISLGFALMLMSQVIKTLSKIDPEKGNIAIGQLVVMIGSMMTMMYAYSKLNSMMEGQDLKSGSKIFMQMAGALMVLSLAMRIMSTMKWEDIGQGLVVISGITAIFAGLMYMTKYAGSDADKAGNLFTKMASAILVLSLAMKLIGTMSVGDIAKGLIVIGGITLIFTKLGETSKIAGEHADQAGKMFRKMASAILVLSLAMKLIATMSVGDISKGLIVIGGVTLIFKQLSKSTEVANKDSSKVGSAMLKMSLAIGLLSMTMRLLSGLSIGDVVKGLAVVMTSGLLFKALIAISKDVDKDASKAGSMILKMSFAITVLALAIRLIAGLSLSEIATGLIFIAGCAGLFSALIAVSKYAGEHADKAGEMLMKMTIPIAALALCMALLSFLDPAKLASASASLSMAIAAFSLIIKASSSAEKIKIAPLLIMTAAVGIIAGIVYGISLLPMKSTLEKVVSISLLLMAMSASLKIVSDVKTVSKDAMVGLAVILGAVVGVATILGILDALNVEPSIETAVSLSILLIAMAGVCAILGALGPASKLAIQGAAAFDAVVAIIGGLMIAIGALVSYIPSLETFLDKGIDVLCKIGFGIGEFVGSIASGFATGLTSGLSEIADNLSDFMVHLQPFLDSAKSIDPTIVDSVSALAGAMLAITGAGLLDSIAKFISFGNDPLEQFATQMPLLGQGLSGFARNVTGLDIESVRAATEAAKNLSEMANSIPGSAPLWGIFGGGKDLASFGSDLVLFGTSLNTFAQNTSGVNPETIGPAAQAAETLAKMANNIPESAPLWGLFGGKDLGAFGFDLQLFGSALKNFATEVQGIDPATITPAAEAAKVLSEMANNIPEDGGLFSIFSIDKDLGSFGSQLRQFGQGLKSFAQSVQDIDAAHITSVISTIDNLRKVISEFAKTGIDSIKTSFDDGKTKVIKSVKDVLNGITEAVTKEESKLKKAGKQTGEYVVAGLNDGKESYYNSFKSVGSYVVDGFASGISDNTFKAEAKAKAMATAALNAAKAALDVNSPSKEFYKVGAFGGQGFVNAFSDYEGTSYDAGYSLAEYATNGLTKAMSYVNRVLSSDMDMQPTIRPVLDLSNVNEGIGSMNGMFGMQPSVGLMSDINAISSGMARIQNEATNSDVLAAIKDLKSTISNVPGTTNNYINGVTYDDGSNISDAVRTLIDAAKVERRI